MNMLSRQSYGALPCAASLLFLSGFASAQTDTYTSDGDFDSGVMVNVNHDVPNSNQLQLGTSAAGTSILSVACGGTGTVVRIDTTTGAVLGEYSTAPFAQGEDYDRDPSRATVDLAGNTWVGNRLEQGLGADDFGSVAKIGSILGGTRVDADGTPNPTGGYLAPPYLYNTCVDRDQDGLIRTSLGLGDVLPWPHITDGNGGTDARVQDAMDECILIFQRTGPRRVRHLSVNANNDIWAGGYPNSPSSLDLLDGQTGEILTNLGVTPLPGCGGYAGVVDDRGVLWSTSVFEGSLLRYDGVNPAECITVQPNVRGIAVSPTGDLWTTGGRRIVRVAPDGTVLNNILLNQTIQLHGIAIRPGDGSIWVASSGTGEVWRLDPNGALIAKVPLNFGGFNGASPRGVATDRQGNVWVANFDSDDVMRIDPATNQVDMRVALRPGSAPYNPSDMTGEAVLNTLSSRGHWDAITDAGLTGSSWDSISWNASEPSDSLIAISLRAADTVADLGELPWISISNGAAAAQMGRYLQTRVEFLRATDGTSPILFDLTVNRNEGPMGCQEVDRSRPGSLLLFPEFDNVTASVTILSVTHTGLSEIDVEYVYIDGDSCQEFNRTERLTPNDTLTLLTEFHNPEQARGFVYVFVKDPVTGEAIVSNTLIGNAMVVSGGFTPGNDGNESAVEYSINAISFPGIGQSGPTDHNSNGLRDLDGVEYAQAPAQILIPRFMGQSHADGLGSFFRSSLILLSLSGGSQFNTTLNFLIYNDNEEVFSAQHSFYCWQKTSLLDVSLIFGGD
ncbi:MAG: hypothetical protein ACI9F9_003290, partial [Candidatus Paceibacteria bacterium]